MKEFLRDWIETILYGRPKYIEIDRLEYDGINLAIGAKVIQYIKLIDYKPTLNIKGEKAMSKKFFIAGVQFRPNAAEIIKGLSEGDELDLEPEPDNKFDSNAVKINYTDLETGKVEHLGYVPKKFSAEITAAIETDGLMTLTCTVTKVDPNAKKWEMCEVEILTLEDGFAEDEPNYEEDDEFEDEEEV